MEDRKQDTNGCCQQPALDDLALLAAIDGEASSEVMTHLRACESCAARAQHFAKLQGLLREQFFRMFCPTTDDLVAFHYGTLAPEQRGSLDAHLLDCPHCHRELRLLKQITNEALAGRPPPLEHIMSNPSPMRPPIVAHARRVVAELVRLELPLQMIDMYGAPRGLGRTDQYAYQAENLQITIDVQRVVNHSDRRVLFGALLIDDDLPRAGCHASAYSAHDNQLIRTAELDELGNFILDDMLPGVYRLALHLPDCEVVIEAISL